MMPDTKKPRRMPTDRKPRSKAATKPKDTAPKTARKPRTRAAVEPLAAETSAYGKREDRQNGRTNYGRPFDKDRFNAGAGPAGPLPQDYMGSTGPTLGVSVAVKVLTLTIGAGTITPAVAGAVTDYVVDWGDGLSDTYASAGAKTHTYAAAGTWTVTCTQRVKNAAGAGVGGGRAVTTATTT